VTAISRSSRFGKSHSRAAMIEIKR
jgi:hypothetical protein